MSDWYTFIQSLTYTSNLNKLGLCIQVIYLFKCKAWCGHCVVGLTGAFRENLLKCNMCVHITILTSIDWKRRNGKSKCSLRWNHWKKSIVCLHDQNICCGNKKRLWLYLLAKWLILIHYRSIHICNFSCSLFVQLGINPL